MDNIRSILFVELLGGIGDVLIALPAIHALGRAHPSAQLTVLTFAPGGDLLCHDPLIHQVIHVKQGEARTAVDQLLTHERFDLIVSDTSYEGIDAAICKSDADRVVTNLWRSPPPNEFVSNRFLAILLSEGLIAKEAIDVTSPQIHLLAEERSTARKSLGAAYRPLVCLYPDAGMQIKRWPSSYYIALGKALQQQYGATILVPVGSDPTPSAQIARSIGGSALPWERRSLRELAAVLAEADLVVAADTGPARIAAALNVPTITLFGPSWQGRYGQLHPHTNLQGYPGCPDRIIANFTEQRCWYSGQCPYEWQTCLEDISVQDVLQAAATYLGNPKKQGTGGREQKTGNLELRIHNSELRTQNASPISYSPLLTPQPTSDWNRLRNLLVMRLDNIGDVLMLSPALRALRENLPQAKITLMASPAGSLTEPLLPWVDEVLRWRVLWQDLGRLDFDPRREWELIETLKAQQYDAAIIFTSFTQSPHPPALICALAGIPLRLGESKEVDMGTLTHMVRAGCDEMHQVDRNLRLIESVGFQVRDRSLCLQVPTSHTPLSDPYILLNPWTSCQSRNYDSDRFAVAARRLGEITGWSVVVTGVEKDRDHSHSLLGILGPCAIDLVGKTTLSELVALVANAKLVLTNNTSTMHIADATNTPNVVLFAGTELECQWQPRHSPSRLLRRPTVCSPCYGFVCPYELECLDITPDSVVVAGLELLEEQAALLKQPINDF